MPYDATESSNADDGSSSAAVCNDAAIAYGLPATDATASIPAAAHGSNANARSVPSSATYGRPDATPTDAVRPTTVSSPIQMSTYLVHSYQ